MFEPKKIINEMGYLVDGSNKLKDFQTKIIKQNDEQAIEKVSEDIKNMVARKFEARLRKEEVYKGSQIEADIEKTIIEYLNDQEYEFKPNSLKMNIIERFILSLSGYGILQPLMDDDAIEEIYITAYNNIRYLKNGSIHQSDIKFESDSKFKAFIDNVLSRIGRSVNVVNPIEDGRLPDGSRIAVSTEAISPNGTTANIRKFRKDRITLPKLVEFGSIDDKTAELLKAIVAANFNFIISGGTNTGKTTLLNAMAQYFTKNEHIITIEDNVELQLNSDFWVQLEGRKPNLEGNGEITLNDLLVHVLRRAPGRIIVGEVRDGAVADTFINAIQTGHDGCITTIHANDIDRARERLVKLASNASGTPYRSQLNDFNHSIEIIIQTHKSKIDNRRWVQEIAYICNDGTVCSLMHYDWETNQFIHTNQYPEEMLQKFKEYHIELN